MPSKPDSTGDDRRLQPGRRTPVRLRTYKAFTHDEAFEAARNDLGADLLVVQSRRLRRRGLLGIWQRPIVELTVSVPEPTPGSQSSGAPSGEVAVRASRAYGSVPSPGSVAESSPTAAPLDMDLERAKTRRLAQALMV